MELTVWKNSLTCWERTDRNTSLLDNKMSCIIRGKTSSHTSTWKGMKRIVHELRDSFQVHTNTDLFIIVQVH